MLPSETRNGVRSAFLAPGVVLNWYQRASGATGEIGQRPGGRVVRVTHGGDDGLRASGEGRRQFQDSFGCRGRVEGRRRSGTKADWGFTWFGWARNRLTRPWPRPRFPPVIRTMVGAILSVGKVLAGVGGDSCRSNEHVCLLLSSSYPRGYLRESHDVRARAPAGNGHLAPSAGIHLLPLQWCTTA